MFPPAMRTPIAIQCEGVSTGMDTYAVNLHGPAGIVILVELRIDILRDLIQSYWFKSVRLLWQCQHGIVFDLWVGSAEHPVSNVMVLLAIYAH